MKKSKRTKHIIFALVLLASLPIIIFYRPESYLVVYSMGLFLSFRLSFYYQQLYEKTEIKERTLVTLLQKEQREKKMILAKFGHEIRTPLSKIMGFSELLYFDVENGKSIDLSDCKTILQSSKELLDIVKSISKYAMLEMSFIQNTQSQTLSIDFIMGTAMDNIKEMAQYKNITLNYIGEKKIVTNLDGNILSRIFVSAIAAMIKLGNNQELTIQLQEPCIVHLSLDKIALSKDEIDYLLNPFEAPNTVNTNFDMGIGVYYCKRLLEQMDSSIELFSQVEPLHTKMILTLVPAV